MKTVAYIILLTMNFGFLRAQTEPMPFAVPGNGYDSTYNYIERKSYSVIKTDTLEFYDGTKVYRMIEVQRFRPDTAMKTESATYNFKADTINETLTYPVYPEKLKKLRIPVVDTIYDPSDFTKYQVEKTDSIEIDFAKSYHLDPTTFFQTIRKIERMVEFQGLNVAEIYLRFYPYNGQGSVIETLDQDDFEDLDFLSVNFLLENNGLMMDYPIIFEK